MENLLKDSEIESFLSILEERFMKNSHRHPKVEWKTIKERLLKSKNKLWSLNQMEKTSGEPDVIGGQNPDGSFSFIDCSKESPKDRRSLCYDKKAWEERKQHKPVNNAIDVATQMGVEILDSQQYKLLQSYGDFDTKTSSWLKTPEEIRKLGGAIFGDKRYNNVFVYHNGAESYYSSRGFRTILYI